jgi:hypothetical protein
LVLTTKIIFLIIVNTVRCETCISSLFYVTDWAYNGRQGAKSSAQIKKKRRLQLHRVLEHNSGLCNAKKCNQINQEIKRRKIVKTTTHNLILSAIISFVICLTGTAFAQEDAVAKANNTSKAGTFQKALQEFASADSTVPAVTVKAASDMMENMKIAKAKPDANALDETSNASDSDDDEILEVMTTLSTVLSTATTTSDGQFMIFPSSFSQTLYEWEPASGILMAVISQDVITLLKQIENETMAQTIAMLAVMSSQVPEFLESLSTTLQSMTLANSICNTINSFECPDTDMQVMGICITAVLSESGEVENPTYCFVVQAEQGDPATGDDSDDDPDDDPDDPGLGSNSNNNNISSF